MPAQVNAGSQENAGTATQRPYTISKETTYFTGPLKPDGSIDFIAAVNAHFSLGVTAGNNAAEVIVSLMPAEQWFSNQHRDRVLSYFEIDTQKETNQVEFVALYHYGGTF